MWAATNTLAYYITEIITTVKGLYDMPMVVF
jgi:hypothetical protein